MDCCGSLIKFMLIVLNIIFLLIGLVVFIIAAILHWAKNVIIGILDQPELEAFIDLSGLKVVSTVLLIIGAFIILLSTAGLIGACYGNRFFLVVYEILIILIFLTHLVVLIVGVVKADDVETLYRKALNTTMTDLNNETFIETKPDVADSYCKGFRLLSQTFKCCGVNGPNDFKLNATLSKICCYETLDTNTGDVGCANKSWTDLKNGVVSILVIPNSVMLGFEFLIIVTVPILIKKNYK